MSTSPGQFYLKDAYALAYAAFRLASSLDSLSFRQAVEKRGLELLLAALDVDGFKQEKLLRDLEYLIGFGRDTAVIHPQTAELMLKEIHKFNPAIAGLNGSGVAIEKDINPAKIVEPIPAIELFPKREAVVETVPSIRTEEIIEPKIIKEEIVFGGTPSESFNIRKERILAQIRQSGNSNNPAIGCRLRDIQELMPELSERTLRYDLQRLIQEGLIERVGNSGPSTFYRVRA
jgi:hypothetical protein